LGDFSPLLSNDYGTKEFEEGNLSGLFILGSFFKIRSLWPLSALTTLLGSLRNIFNLFTLFTNLS
jgi:hypothetical protein